MLTFGTIVGHHWNGRKGEGRTTSIAFAPRDSSLLTLTAKQLLRPQPPCRSRLIADLSGTGWV